MITIQNIFQTPCDHGIQSARNFEVNNRKYHQSNTITRSKGSSNTNQPRIYIMDDEIEASTMVRDELPLQI